MSFTRPTATLRIPSGENQGTQLPGGSQGAIVTAAMPGEGHAQGQGQDLPPGRVHDRTVTDKGLCFLHVVLCTYMRRSVFSVLK
jgi:hypothetical protein